MDKEQALEDFFSTVKTTLNISSLYSPEHPYFIKSVSELKKKCDTLFGFSDSIKLGFAPNQILVEDKTYQKKGLHDEIAKVFHSRKIKSLEISPDVSTDELVYFLNKISLRPAELIKAGGVFGVIDKAKLANICIQELDYSSLLKAQGQETKEIWPYLLKEATQERDSFKIDELVHTFEQNIAKYNLKDFLDNQELVDSLNKFIQYLQDSNVPDSKKCKQQLCYIILKEAKDIEPEKFDKIKKAFEYLGPDEMIDSLVEYMADGDIFDALNFKLFLKLIDNDKRNNIAENLIDKLKDQSFAKHHPVFKERIKELFIVGKESGVSDVYRHQLSSILDAMPAENKVILDRQELKNNYRFLLLELLLDEKDIGRLALIVTKINAEIKKIIQDSQWHELRYFLDAMDKKITIDPYTTNLFIETYKYASDLAESLIVDGTGSNELRYLTKYLTQTYKDPDFYLQKIFVEGRTSPDILELFFKFFPQEINNFIKMLDRKIADMDFLGSIINSLALVGYPQVLEIYKHIFSVSNDFVKASILRAMGSFRYKDEQFLFSILSNKNLQLRKEAVIILCIIQKPSAATMNALFGIKNYFGLNNALLLENMRIIEDLGIKDAAKYLEVLSRKRFFWNSRVRIYASQILRKWNDSKS